MENGERVRGLSEKDKGIKQKKKKLIDIDNSMVINYQRERGWGEVEEGKGGDKW